MTNGELATLLALVRARVEDGSVRVHAPVVLGLGYSSMPLPPDVHPAALRVIDAIDRAGFYAASAKEGRLAAIDRAIAKLEAAS